MKNTWFDGGSLTFDEYVIPIDTVTGQSITTTTAWSAANKNASVIPTASDATKFVYIFYKDFFIPLTMLHRIFNFSNNLYTCALQRTTMQLFVKYWNSPMANCLGSAGPSSLNNAQGLFDSNMSGIGSLDLWVVAKVS